MRRRIGLPIAVIAATGTIGAMAAPPQAEAVNVVKPICTLAGLLSGIAGKVCSAAGDASGLLKAGTKLVKGHAGAALGALSGASTATKVLGFGAAFAAIGAWVEGGARTVLDETAGVIAATTAPQLESTWFSSSYWRMAGISALLTVPFLFAAALQAVVRADMAQLVRSAFGYLPLGLLAIGIAAPLATMLLSASDEMSAIVSGASSAGATTLSHLGLFAGVLSVDSAFPLFFVALLTVAATTVLWIELLIRAAAVYVVVLMLPLFFAALVWPARRVWAMRAIELLVALILSKFVIVAVLSLGGAALAATALPATSRALAGTTLVMLAAFSPWAVLRLLPLGELAAGLDGLRSRPQNLPTSLDRAQGATQIAEDLVRQLPAPTTELADAVAVDSDGPAGEGPERSLPPDAVASESLAGESLAVAEGGSAGEAGETPAVADGRSAGEAESAVSSDTSAVAANGSDGRAARRPGMEARWQTPNGAWGTMYLHESPGSLEFENLGGEPDPGDDPLPSGLDLGDDPLPSGLDPDDDPLPPSEPDDDGHAA